MTTDEKHLRYWSKSSKLGKTKYALYVGIGWGVLTALITELGSVFLFGDPEGFSLPKLIFRIIFMTITGFFYMRWNWSVNEKRFIQLQQQSEADIKKENL